MSVPVQPLLKFQFPIGSVNGACALAPNVILMADWSCAPICQQLSAPWR